MRFTIQDKKGGTHFGSGRIDIVLFLLDDREQGKIVRNIFRRTKITVLHKFLYRTVNVQHNIKRHVTRG